jgi:hypothetical protein
MGHLLDKLSENVPPRPAVKWQVGGKCQRCWGVRHRGSAS